MELWASDKSIQQRGVANMVLFAPSSVGSSTVSAPVTYWPLYQLLKGMENRKEIQSSASRVLGTSMPRWKGDTVARTFT